MVALSFDKPQTNAFLLPVLRRFTKTGSISPVRSPELALAICSLLEQGFSLRYSCAENGCSDSFFISWIRTDPEIQKQYARAREIQADKLADELIELSDSATPENAHAVRLKVDTRKWIASKLKPKVYGDRPADINVNSVVNIAVLSVEKQQELQERRLKALENVNGTSTDNALPG